MANRFANKVISMALTAASLASCGKGESGEVSGPMSLLALVGIPLLVALAYGFFMSTRGAIRTAVRIPEQRMREGLAEQILSRLRNNQVPGRYWLYLRSYRSDRFAPDWYRAVHGFTTTPDLAVEPTLDERLRDSLEARFGHAVCVGKKDFAIGASRIVSTDANWRADVELLAMKAELIVLMPWDTDAVLEEFCTIMKTSALRSKVIFFMPPFVHGKSMSRHWNAAAARLKILGYKIPPYEDAGGFFSASGKSCSATVILDPREAGVHLSRLLHQSQ